MAVNLSPRQFLEDDLLEKLNHIIKETRIDRNSLDLEITEGLLMQDVERSTEILRDFKKLGGMVSIDDFGTGYSSLAYLRQFPLDTLKIDKSFIQGIDTDERDRDLVQTIITMGHSLNLSIVAEGAENQNQFNILRSQQCDTIQGYYFSRPLPAEELTRKLKKTPYF
jgi:EAL domain-containing protein (putative c-di-GMP-specific phosphodiesterase class I)